jgi:hypothetical protein
VAALLRSAGLGHAGGGAREGDLRRARVSVPRRCARRTRSCNTCAIASPELLRCHVDRRPRWIAFGEPRARTPRTPALWLWRWRVSIIRTYGIGVIVEPGRVCRGPAEPGAGRGRVRPGGGRGRDGSRGSGGGGGVRIRLHSPIQIVDMPASTVDLLHRFLRQGGGRLSGRVRAREFAALTDAEVARVERLYSESFTGVTPA